MSTQVVYSSLIQELPSSDPVFLQTFHHGGRDHTIDLGNVPTLGTRIGETPICSSSTITSLGTPFAPIQNYIDIVRPLENKIEVLQATAAKLTDARQHATRDKIIAVLKTAFLVTLLVASILALIYGSPVIAGVLGTLGLQSYVMGSFAAIFGPWHELLTNKNATSFIPEYNNYGRYHVTSYEFDRQPVTKGFAAIILGMLFGSFAPIYAAFTRTSSLERVFEQQKKDLEASKEENAKQFSQIVAYYLEKGALAKQFFTKHTSHLEGLLKESPKCEIYRMGMLENERDLRKVQAVLDFYNQFIPVIPIPAPAKSPMTSPTISSSPSTSSPTYASIYPEIV